MTVDPLRYSSLGATPAPSLIDTLSTPLDKRGGEGGPRRSPLHREHLDLGARMLETDGWTMPGQFAGVLGEYRAYRRRSVVWDASNLGSVVVSGPGAAEVVGRTFTNDIQRTAPGRSQYTLLLAEADAGILDELIVWRLDFDRFVLIPNRPQTVIAALSAVRDRAGVACSIKETTSERILLAVQGPAAAARVAEIDPAAATLTPRSVLQRRGGVVASTRFGGLHGFEFHVDLAVGRDIYRRLVNGGTDPVGMAVRETLRFDWGVPRYGVDLRPDVTPLETGSLRVVGFDTDFQGRTALIQRRRLGPKRLLRMLVGADRRIPHAGTQLFAGERPVGWITSSNFSLSLHRSIAFAFVAADLTPGSHVRAVNAEGSVDAELTAFPMGVDAAQAPVSGESRATSQGVDVGRT